MEALDFVWLVSSSNANSPWKVGGIFTQCSESGGACKVLAESRRLPGAASLCFHHPRSDEKDTPHSRVSTDAGGSVCGPPQQSVRETPSSWLPFSGFPSKERMPEKPGTDSDLALPGCSVQLEHFKLSFKMELTVLSNSPLCDVMFDRDYRKKF